MDPIPVRLSEELQLRVDALADELSMSRSAVLRLAVRQWLDAVASKGINPMLREEPELPVTYRHPKRKQTRNPSKTRAQKGKPFE